MVHLEDLSRCSQNFDRPVHLVKVRLCERHARRLHKMEGFIIYDVNLNFTIRDIFCLLHPEILHLPGLCRPVCWR